MLTGQPLQFGLGVVLELTNEYLSHREECYHAIMRWALAAFALSSSRQQ